MLASLAPLCSPMQEIRFELSSLASMTRLFISCPPYPFTHSAPSPGKMPGSAATGASLFFKSGDATRHLCRSISNRMACGVALALAIALALATI